jgi:TolB-like protein/DNA-binding winged helix-turn-helix (wHTH) protein/Tfp pilus assembly protein PilF
MEMQRVRSSQETIRFGAFDVDLRAGELRKQGVKIKLQEQPFQILHILLEQPGEVVTREEIQRRLWPSDTFVDFEHGLYNAIKRLREALGDSADTPRYIETLSKRGYRYIGSVNGTDSHGGATEAAASIETQSAHSSRYRPIAIAAAAVVAAASTVLALDLGGVRSRLSSRVNVPAIHSLAVLPLTNLSSDPNQEYFAEGMTDALITELSQIRALKVISRTTTIRYKKTDKSLPQIARELGVDGIVEGTVQRSGERARITAQLIYGPGDRHLWAKSYERDLQDVLRLEQDIATVIAQEIRAQLTPQEEARLGQSRGANPKALEAYLQGHYRLNRIGRGAGREDYRRAIEYFQQAIAEDPHFAPAYAWLAEIYDSSFSAPNEIMPLEKAAVARALELDPRLAKAHQLLASIRFFYDWDWTGAERELKQAVDLDPNSAWTHNRISIFLAVVGRREEALSEAQRARELDPANEYLAETLTLFGQYDQAIEVLRKHLEFNPDDGYAHFNLFETYVLKGMQQESIKELQETWRLFGFDGVASSVRRAYGASGYQGAMQVSAKELEQLHAQKALVLPAEIAKEYAFLGDKEQAFKWLEKAYEERDGGIVFLARDAAWDSLRSDARFQNLLRRVGLPQ